MSQRLIDRCTSSISLDLYSSHLDLAFKCAKLKCLFLTSLSFGVQYKTSTVYSFWTPKLKFATVFAWIRYSSNTCHIFFTGSNRCSVYKVFEICRASTWRHCCVEEDGIVESSLDFERGFCTLMPQLNRIPLISVCWLINHFTITFQQRICELHFELYVILLWFPCKTVPWQLEYECDDISDLEILNLMFAPHII